MAVKYVNLGLQFSKLKSQILPAIERVLESGTYILGKEVLSLENTIAAYCHSTYALGLANGTDALILSLKALNIGRGDEVITVPNSFIATAGAIVAAGARPVFVDVGEDYNINPDLIEDAINDDTKAIMPVHLTGRPANMHRIMNIAKKYNLYVIEDAAQAIGAKYYGKRVGSLGDIGCFSMHPLKTLNASGDAGFITLQNRVLYEQILLLRNHGLKNRDEATVFGYNSRLDALQAAQLAIKLNYLDSWNERCGYIAAFYRNELSGIVKSPTDKPHEESVYHTFIIQVDKRDALHKYLLQRGIETKIHYPIPLHLQPAAKNLGYVKGDFPVAERQAERILSLPIYPELTQENLEEVVGGIKSFYHHKN